MSAHLPRRAAVAAAACVAVAGGALAIAGTRTSHGAPAAHTAAAAASTTTVPSTKPPAHRHDHDHDHGFGGVGGFGKGRFGGGFGAVAGVTVGGFTVKGPEGTLAFTTSSSTVYRVVGVPVSRSVLTTGERVLVRPTAPAPTGAAARPAAEVLILLPEVGGKVVSASGSQLVVQDAEGFWRTVDLTSSTAYAQGGKPAAAGAVKTGTYVLVAGHIAADHTTLDATAVALLGTDPAGGPGFFGPLGGGAFWPGGAAVFGGPGFLGGPPSGFHPMQPPQGAPSSAGVD